MKKLLYMAVAAIAALSSCTSEDIINGNGNGNANAPVFTATIEGEAATRTTLGLNTETNKYTKVKWDATDEVSVNGTVYTVAPGSDATTATLTKKNSTDASPEPIFKAYYPASLYNEGTATLPASYTYAEGKFNMPMYAESSETSLGFKNICAVLAITVPSTQMTAVSSITVSSDKQMNGAFTATAEGVLTFAEKTLEDADKKVTLTFSTAKAIASSETFYIAIPANTYAYLQIDVTDGTSTKYMRTKAGANIEVERNKIYPIVFDSRIKSFTAAQSINAWKETDKISVNGVTYKFSSYVPDSYYLKATFVPEVEGQAATADASGKYYAIYPASAATDDGKINIPSYINSLSFGEIPIFAESTSNELSFQQLFTYCYLTVNSRYEDLKIKVNSKNNIKLSGTFDPKNWNITTSNYVEKTIVFEGDFDIESGSMGINIPLPAPRMQSEEYEISIDLTFNNGSRTDNGAPIKITFPVLTDGYDGGTRTLN